MRPPHNALRLLFAFLLLAGCQDNKKNETGNDDGEDLSDVWHRIECEPKSRLCDGMDAMRFYKKTIVMQHAPDSTVQAGEAWKSFVVCCTTMGPLLDTLKAYNELIKEAIKNGTAFERSTEIDGIPVRAYVSYGGFPDGKRIEWLSFGGMEFGWILPFGTHFDEYVKELEEARTRCCLL